MRPWAIVVCLCLPLASLAWGQAASAKKPLQAACVVERGALSAADRALSREEYDKAFELYRALEPTEPEASRTGRIRVLIGQNKVDDALAQAESWVKQEPTSAAAEEALSEAQYRAASITTALHTVQQSLAINPCNPRAYLMLGTMADVVGDHAKARDYFFTSHKLAPNDIDIRFAWIGTLPRAQRQQEYEALVREPEALNEADKGRLSDNLAHAQNYKPEDCTLVAPPERATIPIRDITHSPGRGPAGLEVEFNGKRRMLEIDTGASGILLSQEAAAGLHLGPEQQTQVFGVGDHGAVATSLSHVASIRIGGLEFKNCVVAVMQKGVAVQDQAELIGADFFSHYIVTLDFPAMQMRLGPLPKQPDEGVVATTDATSKDGDAETASVHDRYLAPEMKSWTRVFRPGHDLLMPVNIGGTRDRLFLLDTGATLTSISPAAAREVTKVKKGRDIPVYGVSGKVAETYDTGKVSVAFAHVTMTLSRLTAFEMTKLSHSAGVEISGFLGEAILYRGVLHIDYRDNLVRFEYDEMKDPCIYPNLLHYRGSVEMAANDGPAVYTAICYAR